LKKHELPPDAPSNRILFVVFLRAYVLQQKAGTMHRAPQRREKDTPPSVA